MNKTSKITVKHYPNINLKPLVENGKEKHPLYVQVIFDRKIYKFKSENEYFKYVDNQDLENDFICKILETEIKRIERCVSLLAKHNEKLLTSKDIYKYSKPLDKIIEKNLGLLISKEFTQAPQTLTNLSYTEINNLLMFLNAFDKLQMNEKISRVWQIINNLHFSSPEFYEKDYCYIDLFYGDKFNIIYEVIQFTVTLNEKIAKNYLDDFRYFIDL